jgi:hypothetical protein
MTIAPIAPGVPPSDGGRWGRVYNTCCIVHDAARGATFSDARLDRLTT